jgi:cytochrome c oxidase subunit 3
VAQSEVTAQHAIAHHPALAHHFENMEQQREASTLGMWVFLITEIMFFGGLFLAYSIYRSWYPQVFAEASHHLDILLGGINTVVLITSSLTMALAVYHSQVGNRGKLVLFLILTMLLGLTFLGIKVIEYSHKFHDGLIPGIHFHYEGPHPQQAQIFFWLYFAMTGLHALHMIVGVSILAFLIYFAWRGRYSPEYHSPVEISGLYWHFVDIVWIFLFPLLYLVGFHVKG